MPISLNYVARETAINLRRNIAMTIAAVLTVCVSLGLVGGALLMRQGVNKATLQWRGGVELSVFLRPDVAVGQQDAIERELKSTPEVKSYTFVTKAQALEEYKKIFANSSDLLDVVTADDLPPSFRIVPQKAELVDTIGRRFQTRPGVSDVVYAKDAIDKLLKTTRQRQVAYFGVAVVLLFGAVLLILNAIQLAVLSRRREIEVMKLVGATNWFIRIPFMAEGLVQGILGSVIGIGTVAALKSWMLPTLVSGGGIWSGFHIEPADLQKTSFVLIGAGALVGIFGSAVAATRFLDV
ncbi:MAG: cell division transport system permease protein [Acidimicrobiaceae bacterium]